MSKKFLIALAFAAAISLSSMIIPSASAQTSIIDNESSDYQDGNYDLDDMVFVVIRASKIILGIVGSLALLMFIYGGIMFLISSGSSDKIKKAKDILVAAIIGLIIVFGSFLIIKYVLQVMGINWNGTKEISTAVTTRNIMP